MQQKEEAQDDYEVRGRRDITEEEISIHNRSQRQEQTPQETQATSSSPAVSRFSFEEGRISSKVLSVSPGELGL